MQDITRRNLLTAYIICILLPCLIAISHADEWVTVKYVIDGDTIVLTDGRHIRYQGIDAPEIAHDNQPADPFGEEAKLYNKKLVEGQKIRLKIDGNGIDDYGRTLAQVFLADGTWVNRNMVAAGLAYACLYDRESHVAIKTFDELLKAQKEAISARKGMWGAPSVKPEAFYVGNQRTMRLHRTDCPAAIQTGKNNRIVFKDRNEAFMQGFCPCRKCRP